MFSNCCDIYFNPHIGLLINCGLVEQWNRCALGTEQVASSSPGSVGYISHVHRTYDYLDSFGVLWVHMASVAYRGFLGPEVEDGNWRPFPSACQIGKRRRRSPSLLGGLGRSPRRQRFWEHLSVNGTHFLIALTPFSTCKGRFKKNLKKGS